MAKVTIEVIDHQSGIYELSMPLKQTEKPFITRSEEAKAWNFAIQSLQVHGGELVIDLSSTTPELSALISDVAAASWWIDELYGENAGDALRQLAEGEESDADEPPPLTADGTISSFTKNTVKLLQVLWLKRWWPSPDLDNKIPPMSDWVLEVEAATLSWQLEPMIDAFYEAGQLIDRALDEYSAALDQVHQTAFEQDPTTWNEFDPYLNLLVAGMVPAISAASSSDTLKDFTERAIKLEQKLHEWRADRAQMQLDVENLLKELETRDISPTVETAENLALLAGGVHQVEAPPTKSGVAAVDWREINPRLVANTPNPLQWEVRVNDTGEWILSAQLRAGSSSLERSKNRPILAILNFENTQSGKSSEESLYLERSADKYYGETLMELDIEPDSPVELKGVTLIAINADSERFNSSVPFDKVSNISAVISSTIATRVSSAFADLDENTWFQGSVGEYLAVELLVKSALNDEDTHAQFEAQLQLVRLYRNSRNYQAATFQLDKMAAQFKGKEHQKAVQKLRERYRGEEHYTAEAKRLIDSLQEFLNEQ